MSAEIASAAQAADSGERCYGYREITSALIADIRSGAWSIGGQLPTESELTQRFGASRTTVRESLRELDLAGYIKRRRGTRSILLSDDPSNSFVNSVQSIGELLQYSQRTLSRLLSAQMVTVGQALARRLGVEAGGKWLRIEVLRMPTHGALPIGYSEIFVDGRYAAIADRLDHRGPVYQLIEESFGVTFRRVEQVVEAAAATPMQAELLKVAPGSPLMVNRTEFVTSAGEIAEIGFGHFPANRYRIEIMLERGGRGSRSS